MIQAKDIMRVTGLSYRQVQYWDGKIIDQNRTTPSSKYRIFSIMDLMMYAAASELKRQGISLQEIRQKYLWRLNQILYVHSNFEHGSKIIRINDVLFHLRGQLTAPRKLSSKPPFSLVVSYDDCVDKLGMVS